MTLPRTPSRLDILDANLRTLQEAARNAATAGVLAKLVTGEQDAGGHFRRSDTLLAQCEVVEGEIDDEINRLLVREGRSARYRSTGSRSKSSTRLARSDTNPARSS